jgi:hypothetical protein
MGKRGGPKTGKWQLGDVIKAIAKEECCGTVDALMVFGLHAVLAGMSRVPACAEHCIVKGGTALRLALGQPIGRVSTDLDLSLFEATRESFDPTLITSDVARETANALGEALEHPAEIIIRTPEDRTQPAYPGLPALLRYRLVVEARLTPGKVTVANSNHFIIELAVDELVDGQALEDLAVSAYGLPIRLRMYSAVQAMAEKLRALLQKLQHFERTGNAESFQPRHVHDLVLLSRRLPTGYEASLRHLFDQKCERRLVPMHERTVERLTHPALRDAVMRSSHPRSAEAWALLERLAPIVCPRSGDRPTTVPEP